MKFTETHEWIELDKEKKIATCGITNYAQQELGDVVFIQLPNIGEKVRKNDEVVILESTKAAVDLYSPLSGKIVGLNQDLIKSPEKINQDAEKSGWLFKIEIKDLKEWDQLLTEKQYLAALDQEDL